MRPSRRHEKQSVGDDTDSRSALSLRAGTPAQSASREGAGTTVHPRFAEMVAVAVRFDRRATERVVIGLVAGLHPSWRAASLEPVDALRGGARRGATGVALTMCVCGSRWGVHGRVAGWSDAVGRDRRRETIMAIRMGIERRGVGDGGRSKPSARLAVVAAGSRSSWRSWRCREQRPHRTRRCV